MHIDNILIVILIGFVSLGCSSAHKHSRLPRNTNSSTNITDRQLDVNEVITSNQTRNIPIKKGVLRLCCPFGSFASIEFGKFKGCGPNEAAKDFTIEVHDENGRKSSVSPEYFNHVQGLCSEYSYPESWKILPTGDALVDNVPIDHRNYCLSTSPLGVEFLECSKGKDPLNFLYIVFPTVMLTSVAFIIATFIVYVVYANTPQLLTFSMKCFLCYLISLAVFFISFSLIQLNGATYRAPAVCQTVASLAYFSCLSTATWSNAISLDVKKNITKIKVIGIFSKKEQKRKEKIKLLLFMAYGWGVPALLLTIGHTFDRIESVHDYLKPGIGTQTCFLKETRESKFLYYHLPFCILFTINIISFILIALKIREQKKDIMKDIAEDEKHQFQSNACQENFVVYLRILLMMGLTWCCEGLSFIPYNHFMFLVDILNTAQGVIIFVLFVVGRPRVVRLIKSRWHTWRGRESTKSGAPITIDAKTKQNMMKRSRTASTDTTDTTAISID